MRLCIFAGRIYTSSTFLFTHVLSLMSTRVYLSNQARLHASTERSCDMLPFEHVDEPVADIRRVQLFPKTHPQFVLDECTDILDWSEYPAA